MIIGDYEFNSYTGRAYIFFGGVLMDNVADITLTGEAEYNYFGYSVSSAGDVNDDNFSDVIVGAVGPSTGRAYIFFGEPSMNNIADVICTGEGVNNSFGISVSFAGDVNGDGFPDVIVGDNEYNSFTGRAYIYYGGASMNSVADIILTGELTFHNFGYSVSGAGDVNNNGFSDVIIGAGGCVRFPGGDKGGRFSGRKRRYYSRG